MISSHRIPAPSFSKAAFRSNLMPSSPAFMTATLETAIDASTRGDSDQAIALMMKAIQEQPESGLPHFLLGAEYASLGKMEVAEQCFANAVLLAPALVVARYQLGLLQFSSGRASTALITWQPLLALDDQNSPLPHWIKGFAALAGDNFSAARECFEIGLARNSEHPPMSDDIRKVLAQIDAISSVSTPSRWEAELDATTAAQPEESHEDQSSHVLLSNYRQQGPGH